MRKFLASLLDGDFVLPPPRMQIITIVRREEDE